MIQRKQSLWLLISAIISLGIFFSSYGIQHVNDDLSGTMTQLNARQNSILMGSTIFNVVFTLFIIFQFKQRTKQITLCWVAIILQVINLCYMLYDAQLSDPTKKLVVGVLGPDLYLGILLPVLSILFIGLAIMGIKADEKLIRDSDRLR
ncbi:MAG: DUF4293 domain-containing protein [Chitinophagaceae bacterium]|nr:DUF4293 domain-containing protein [Chitinophagaceae bacterium]